MFICYQIKRAHDKNLLKFLEFITFNEPIMYLCLIVVKFHVEHFSS